MGPDRKAAPIIAGGGNDTDRQLALLTRLVLDSWADIDRNDGRAYSGFFTADGILDSGSARVQGRVPIAESTAARAASGTRTTRHVVSNLSGDPVGDQWQVSHLIQVFAAEGDPPAAVGPPVAIGDVQDTFTLVEGRWLIRSRTYRAAFVQGRRP